MLSAHSSSRRALAMTAVPDPEKAVLRFAPRVVVRGGLKRLFYSESSRLVIDQPLRRQLAVAGTTTGIRRCPDRTGHSLAASSGNRDSEETFAVLCQKNQFRTSPSRTLQALTALAIPAPRRRAELRRIAAARAIRRAPVRRRLQSPLFPVHDDRGETFQVCSRAGLREKCPNRPKLPSFSRRSALECLAAHEDSWVEKCQHAPRRLRSRPSPPSHYGPLAQMGFLTLHSIHCASVSARRRTSPEILRPAYELSLDASLPRSSASASVGCAFGTRDAPEGRVPQDASVSPLAALRFVVS